MSRKVPNGWKKYKLGDIVRLNPYSIDSNFKYSQIVYLDTGSIKEGKITELKEYKLTDAPSSAKRLVKNNNIIYSTVRPIQRHYGIIKNPPDNMVVSNGFVVLEAIEEIIDPYFLYYFLTLDKIIDTLEAIAEASSSVYPTFRIPVLENLTIFLPPLPEQKAIAEVIAEVLSPLDDKIDLLTRQNKTLEDLAQAYFRFTAKQTEKKQTVPLSDIAEIITGKIAPIEEYNKKEGKTVKLASVRDFDYSKIYITDTKEHITQETVDKMHYTIAPANTVLFVYQMSPGKVALTGCPMVTKTAIAQLRIKDNAYITPEYLYLYLKNFNYDTLIVSRTIVTAINKSKIGDIPIVIPDKETMNKFTEQIVPLFTKVKTNNYTIQTLERLRDALLPALISGKIRVV